MKEKRPVDGRFSYELFRVQYLSNCVFLDALAVAVVVIAERDLGVAPGVEVANLMDALDRAGRGTPFFGDVLAFHVLAGVFEQRNTGRATLLRAPADNAAFVNVQ